MSEPKSKMSNRQFSQEDMKFRSACEKVGIKPTARQASKYRNKKGLAFKGGKQ